MGQPSVVSSHCNVQSELNDRHRCKLLGPKVLYMLMLGLIHAVWVLQHMCTGMRHTLLSNTALLYGFKVKSTVVCGMLLCIPVKLMCCLPCMTPVQMLDRCHHKGIELQ